MCRSISGCLFKSDITENMDLRKFRCRELPVVEMSFELFLSSTSLKMNLIAFFQNCYLYHFKIIFALNPMDNGDKKIKQMRH